MDVVRFTTEARGVYTVLEVRRAITEITNMAELRICEEIKSRRLPCLIG